MIKKIWHISGDIRVSFILLMLAAATLFVGSIYADSHYSFFMALNRLRVQDWLDVYLLEQPSLSWWIPVLFIVMGCLGINTFICVCNRMVALISRKQTLSNIHFFYLLTPSIIHFLFIVILFGHLMTFTLGRWQSYFLEQGKGIAGGQNAPSFVVTAIQDEFYPEGSGMKDRIAQTIVTLSDSKQSELTLTYLSPRLVGRDLLFLDKAKKRNKDLEGIKQHAADLDNEENCNKAEIYKEKKKKTSGHDLRLLIVTDPGVYIILTGLALIMSLMIFYFLFQLTAIRPLIPRADRSERIPIPAAPEV